MKKQTSDKKRTVTLKKNATKNFNEGAKTIQKKQHLTVLGILILFSFIIYSNTIPFGYTFDDKIVITKNESTKAGFSGIKDLLTRDAFSNYFGKQQQLVSGGRYRPLAPITLAIEIEFFSQIDENGEKQGNPHVSHAVNILFYALTAFMIYLILSRLLTQFVTRKWYYSIPFLSAILFIAHPLHTEVVANIKGRDEILVLLGSLLALWWVLKYLDTRKIGFIVAATIAFFIAHMSKENAITFLAIIPLSVYFFTNHKLKNNLITLIPLTLAAILFIFIRHSVLGSTFAPTAPELMNNPFLYATDAQKYATIFYTWGIYLKLMIFPMALTYDYYPYHIELVRFTNPVTLLSFVVYIIFGLLAVKGLFKKTLVGYSLCFFFTTFSIVSNLFFPIGAFMNERFIFVPSVAFAILTAYGLYYLFEIKKDSKIAMVSASLILIVLIGFYSIRTFSRNKVWESDFTLFTTDVKTSKGSAFGNLTAGKQFLFKAEKVTDSIEQKVLYEKAINHLTTAVTIHPNYVNGLYFLGEAHYRYNKNYPLTVEYFERLIKLSPDKSQLYYRLGTIYGQYLNNLPKAEYYLSEYLKQAPNEKNAYQAYGAILFNNKQLEKALDIFLQMLKKFPDDPGVHQNLNVLYNRIGDHEQALYHQQMIQKLDKTQNR